MNTPTRVKTSKISQSKKIGRSGTNDGPSNYQLQ
jgi:hypothetical protein